MNELAPSLSTPKSKHPLKFVVLAAGQGTRMRSQQPKVLHLVAGVPMIHHILRSIELGAPASSVALVVGWEKEKVIASIRNAKFDLDIEFVEQKEQLGTGHAIQCVADSSWGQKNLQSASAKGSKSLCLIFPGDLPLISPELVERLAQPLPSNVPVRLLTTVLSDPTGYGRIVRRGKSGPVLKIVEEKDASIREKCITEVALSIYAFQPSFLKVGVQKLINRNSQKEFYLTDLIAQTAKSKRPIEVLEWPDPSELRGVNDPWELAQAGKILQERICKRWALAGVRFQDPASTWIDHRAQFGSDVEVAAQVQIQGSCRIDARVKIGPNVILKNSWIHEGGVIKAGSYIEDSQVGQNSSVGPYAHLRPGSQVGEEVKIGNFVELKNSKIGNGTSIAHLSYLGDAEVGERVNIGCGFITCNFDGRVIDGKRKHPTYIGDDAFIGSDCQTVAPVHVGSGAYVASGSTVTDDVEPSALAIARSRQINKPDYAKKLRKPLKP